MGKGARILRDKRLWWAVASVVVLAAVILVASALSDPSRRPSQVPTPSPAAEAQSLATQADAALSEGETSTALTLAERALDKNPDNTTALRVVERVERQSQNSGGQASAGGSGESTTSAVSDVGIYGKTVSETDDLLPASIEGWITGTVVLQKTESLVTFEPQLKTAPAKTTVRVLIIAHDRGSASKAAAFVSKVDKRVYSKNATNIQVGARQAYFGTDGARLAVVAFARGRYAFEVILTAQPRVKPGTLRDVAIRVASDLPAAK